MPPMPKAGEESRAAFRALVPDAPGVEVRPMFGNLAAFVNRNMFLALFGSDVAVRLPEADRTELLGEEGAAPFEPMPGRAMKEYVVLPAAWHGDRGRLEPWVERSLRYVAAMPPKKGR
jgi:TfoX/Sxy family transcriptional regulator of competence genes